MSALQISNLRLTIGSAEILKGVSLAAAPGEITALVGESGSGKSLTLLSAMRLLPRRAALTGEIRLGEENLLALDEARMCALRGASIGMVFQEPMSALNPVRPIGEQIAETVRLHRQTSRAEAAAMARAALDGVGLKAIGADRYPHELSGGQRQRVAIAIATVLRPKVLLADEPTTALDVITQEGVLDLFRVRAREEGAAIVLVTHDLALVARIADRVAIMHRGEIVEEGRAPAIFSALSHPYSRALLAAASPPPLSARAPKADAPVVLSVRDAVVEYRNKQNAFRAVDGVSLSIRAGESLGVVGESGSGKSTLARAVLGLAPVASGAIEIAGADWRRMNAAAERAARRQAQIVFQDPYASFNPRQRVAQLVAEPLHLLETQPGAAERRKLVEEALARVRLPAGAADRFPHQFSGGERQRIAIARALITRPALVVLDEAVSALDVSIRAQILQLLAELRDTLGLAYLFITHDLAVVRAVADRIVVMQAGKIVEEGPAAAMFEAPQHPYTAALAAASPHFDQTRDPS